MYINPICESVYDDVGSDMCHFDLEAAQGVACPPPAARQLLHERML